MGFGAQPGATDEVFLAVVDDMEDQAVVAPFEVAVQVRVQPRPDSGISMEISCCPLPRRMSKAKR